MPNYPFIHPSGQFVIDVVGESHYQDHLLFIAGPKTRQRKNLTGIAYLILEDDSPYDPLAIRVEIRNQCVGYMNKNAAPVLRKQIAQTEYKNHKTFVCRAQINGGWKDEKSEGSFGVKLDIPSSLQDNISIKNIPEYTSRQKPKKKNKFSSSLFGKKLILHDTHLEIRIGYLPLLRRKILIPYTKITNIETPRMLNKVVIYTIDGKQYSFPGNRKKIQQAILDKL